MELCANAHARSSSSCNAGRKKHCEVFDKSSLYFGRCCCCATIPYIYIYSICSIIWGIAQCTRPPDSKRTNTAQHQQNTRKNIPNMCSNAKLNYVLCTNNQNHWNIHVNSICTWHKNIGEAMSTPDRTEPAGRTRLISVARVKPSNRNLLVTASRRFQWHIQTSHAQLGGLL